MVNIKFIMIILSSPFREAVYKGALFEGLGLEQVCAHSSCMQMEGRCLH